MVKYAIIEYLKTNESTSNKISDDLNIDINTVRVTLNRLTHEGIVIFVKTDYGCIYKLKNNTISQYNDEYRVAFEELFKFFVEIMANVNDVVKDKDKWNSMWDKRNKSLVYKLGKGLIK